ncbi:ATP synthase F1 subunit 1 [Tanacetum coccineum]
MRLCFSRLTSRSIISTGSSMKWSLSSMWISSKGIARAGVDGILKLMSYSQVENETGMIVEKRKVFSLCVAYLLKTVTQKNENHGILSERAELTTLLESRISNFYTNFQVDEIGRVVSVGDGIARVYGLNEIQAGDMVEFASGVKGIALNLENENVGIVVFGSDTAIKEGGIIQDAPVIVDVAGERLCLGVWSDALGTYLLWKGGLSDTCVDVSK